MERNDRFRKEYSKRLGVLTAEQFQLALDRFDLGKFKRADSITGGLFGQNVFISSKFKTL